MPSNAHLIAKAVAELTVNFRNPLDKQLARLCRVSIRFRRLLQVTFTQYRLISDARLSLIGYYRDERLVLFMSFGFGKRWSGSVFIAWRTEERNSPRATLLHPRPGIRSHDGAQPQRARVLAVVQGGDQCVTCHTTSHESSALRTPDLAAPPKPILVL